MRLRELSEQALAERMQSGTLSLELGIARFNIQSPFPAVVKNLARLYANHRICDDDALVDFYIQVRGTSGMRKWLHPQVEFIADQHSPFAPLPKAQAYPLMEWGMNWCIASHCHNYLLLHAAVLAKGEQAIICPAPPGSGKSTLTTYLSHSGWRLLSDEMAVINLETGKVVPFVRPICLKNDAIDITRNWFPDAVISDVANDTNKGDVAHVRPPVESLQDMYLECGVRGIVFPRYNPKTPIDVLELDKCSAFMQLAENGFNHNVLGKQAFHRLTALVEGCTSYEMHYSDMQSMVDFMSDVVEGRL